MVTAFLFTPFNETYLIYKGSMQSITPGTFVIIYLCYDRVAVFLCIWKLSIIMFKPKIMTDIL